MTPAVKVRAVSLSNPRIITPRDTPMTSRLSLTNTNSQDLLSADGAFDPDDFKPHLMAMILTSIFT